MIAKERTKRLSAVALSRASLFRAAMRFESRSRSECFSQVVTHHRNALSKIVGEDAEQGLGMAMSIACFTLRDSRVRWIEKAQTQNKTGGNWGIGYNVYRSVREKQGIVVYRQRVLQTVTSLGVVSLVFRRHDLLKIANFNPQQEARFSLWKKLVPRESGGNGA